MNIKVSYFDKYMCDIYIYIFLIFNSIIKGWKTAKGAVLFFATLLCLSPILKTLTKDTSSDTIWALTVILFLANMLFHDYGSENRTNIK